MPPEDDVTNGRHADVIPTEDLRWSKNKFYTRKPKIPKPEPAPTPVASGDDIAFSTPLPHPPSVMSSSSPPPPPPQPQPPPPESATEMTWPPAEDKNDGAAIVSQTISIDLHSYTKTELRQLRRKLAAELDQVRSMLRRTEEFLGADTAPTAAECENSQHSIYITEPEPTTAESHNLNKSPNLFSAAGGGDFELSPNSHFSNQNKNLVVVGRDFGLSPDSHNYLYKVNQNQDPNLVAAAGCSNFEFSPNNHSYNDLENASRYPVEHDSLVVDKEMISQPERNLFLGRKLDSAFKSCGSLLTRLMRHKFGWVFNKPVDVRGLGLYDYYTIIREPMDLGTVKTRLSKKRYKTLSEFARDVRLTFNNAMRYNPKGQDVHIMAEQLLKIFDERWPAIEAASAYCPPAPLPPRPPPPPPVKPHWLVAHPGSGRNRALDKPKAKDLHKRDMTMDEKGRLRSKLEDLPVEKLNGIVQIIHKRTSNLNQNDDEIEVDFEILDAETLWELDRYVTNYKKSLSKHKRKAELAMLAKQETERKRMQEKVLEPVVVEQSMLNNQVVANQTPRRENRTGSPSESSSSGSSSSDSGSSSSSGPDSDSSSECGSDAAH